MADDKKAKSLTVQDIKEISPLSEVYQLSRYDKYMIIVPMSNLAGGYELAYNRAKQIAIAMKQLELKFTVMIVGGDILEGVRFLEFKEEKI